MTSLPGRHRTALVVVDVQRAVVDGPGTPRRDQVVDTIRTLVDRARAEDAPVIWVQHSGDSLPRDSEGWQYVPELVFGPGEPVVHKRYGDSFDDTDLEERLAEREVGHLVVAGAQTDACIRSTIHGGLVRGYDVTLVSDAHTTEDCTAWGGPPAEDVIRHTNLYWDGHQAPGRVGRAVPAVEIAFASADLT